MQFQFLNVDERFYVRLSEAACARYPAGAFSVISNYPVYAMRVHGDSEASVTDFFIPGSDGTFHWVNMHHTTLARR